MHYVSQRWLGGTLTNFRTIRSRLNRLEELEKLWETGAIEGYSKKMKAALQREMAKIKKNLEGIRRMDKMPGIMFLVDTRREHIAVKEARKLGVTTVAMIDTDGDPDLIDLPIPGNDDAMRAIEIIVRELAESVIEGKASRPDKAEEAPAALVRRRSSRASFRAEGGHGEPGAAGEAAAAAPAHAPAAPATEPAPA
jgi:small subunit ribosomal protein S2